MTDFPEVFASTPNQIQSGLEYGTFKFRIHSNGRSDANCFALIFASRSNTSTSNHHFFASSTIQTRLQRLAIRFTEHRSGTPVCRNLILTPIWSKAGPNTSLTNKIKAASSNGKIDQEIVNSTRPVKNGT